MQESAVSDRSSHGATAAQDAFSFGDDDSHAQGVRNAFTMMTLPFAAMMAIGAEIADETFGPFVR